MDMLSVRTCFNLQNYWVDDVKCCFRGFKPFHKLTVFSVTNKYQVLIHQRWIIFQIFCHSPVL